MKENHVCRKSERLLLKASFVFAVDLACLHEERANELCASRGEKRQLECFSRAHSQNRRLADLSSDHTEACLYTHPLSVPCRASTQKTVVCRLER